jgi:hypothetical protein
MKKLAATLCKALAVLATTWGCAQAGVLTFYTTFAPEGGGTRTGSGNAVVMFDDATNILSFTATFAGLSTGTTLAHFHCCTASAFSGTAGVAVDAPSLAIPLGVTSGTWSEALDLDLAANWSPAFVTASGGTTTGATARFLQNIYENKVYLNIHTSGNPTGEIRGFLVPEPTTAALTLLALAAMGGVARRQRAA